MSSHRLGYPSTSATARVIDGLVLYGHVPAYDDAEHRPMPDESELEGSVAALFQALTGPLTDTALEGELPDVLWSFVDVLHRKADRVQRMLDDNEARQRAAQEEQDGSEIRSVNLERLIDKGRALLDRRAAFEQMRDAAAARFEDFTGSPWRPRSGSMVNRRASRPNWHPFMSSWPPPMPATQRVRSMARLVAADSLSCAF